MDHHGETGDHEERQGDIKVGGVGEGRQGEGEDDAANRNPAAEAFHVGAGGDDEGSDESAETGGAHEKAEAPGPFVEDFVGEDGHEDGVGEPCQADHAEEEEQGPDRSGAGGVDEAFADGFPGGDGVGSGVPRFEAHHKQAGDDRNVANGVEGEAPAFADLGDKDAGDGGADDAGSVEHGGVEGDGIDEVVATDHFYKERLARGDIESVDDAEEGGEDEQLPDLDLIREGEDGEDAGEEHGGGLGGDDDVAAGEAVGGETTEGGEEEDGDLARETDGTEEGGGSGEAVNQPSLGDVLHPGACEGDELAGEEELKIAVAEGAQSVAFSRVGHLFQASRCAGRRRFGGFRAGGMRVKKLPEALVCERTINEAEYK